LAKSIIVEGPCCGSTNQRKKKRKKERKKKCLLLHWIICPTSTPGSSRNEQKVSFLSWVRTLLNDETIVGMIWDDFVGKPRPNRAGKKLDAFNALFQAFSRERTQVSMGTVVTAQAGKEEEEEEEAAAAVGDLTVAFEENLFLSQEEEEHEMPVTTAAAAEQ